MLSDDYLDGVERGANMVCEFLIERLDQLPDDLLATTDLLMHWVHQWVDTQETMAVVSGVPVFAGEVIDGD